MNSNEQETGIDSGRGSICPNEATQPAGELPPTPEMSRIEQLLLAQSTQLQNLSLVMERLSDRVTKLETDQSDNLKKLIDDLANCPTPTGVGRDFSSRLSSSLQDHSQARERTPTGHVEFAQRPEVNNITRPRNPPSSTMIAGRPALDRHRQPASLTATVIPPPIGFFDEPPPEPQGTLPSVPPARISLMPKDYDGKEPWSVYQRHFEAVARANGWCAGLKALYIVPYLRGTALQYYDTLPENVRENFALLSHAMLDRFSDEHQQSIAHIQLRSRFQRSNESLAEYATDIQRLAYISFNDCPEAARNRIALGQFIDGIADMETQRRVRDSIPESLEAALAQAIRIEANRDATRISRRNVRVSEATSISRVRRTRASRQQNQQSGN